FVCSPGPTRVLHSFPTRRSSDLTKVVFSDGVTQYLRVRWADVAARRVARPGRFLVRGRVSGISVPARLLVTVTRHVATGQNLALDRKSTRLNSSHVEIS